jgi:tRNA(Ile)-lysidine synthase
MSQSLDLALVKFWGNILPPPVLVAVSGGPDSLALLHMLLRQNPRFRTFRLEVAHFNHRIRGEAAELDARFVEEFCHQNEVPFHLGQLDVPSFAAAHNLSVEDAARQARYAWLSDLAARREINLVLTGHNADDQAETVLLRLLRGTGPRGLAGMAVLTPLPPPHPALITAFPQAGSTEVRLGRPFLAVWRHDIEAYIRENGLEPRQDETNLEENYARNRVRHRLLPFLESEYQPQIKANLVRLAGLSREDEDWLDELAEAEFLQNSRFEFGCQVVFGKKYFLEKPVALQKRLVRQAAQALSGLQNLDASHIEAVLELFRSAKARRMDLPGKLVAFTGKNGAGLLAVPESVNWPENRLSLAVPGAITGPGGWWRLTTRLVKEIKPQDFLKQGSPYHVFLDYAKIDTQLRERPWVRPRRAGERYRPLGAPGQRKIQDIMLDAGIPRELRRDWPVLVSPGKTEQPDTICWIPGAPIADDFRVTPETAQVLELWFEFLKLPEQRK